MSAARQDKSRASGGSDGRLGRAKRVGLLGGSFNPAHAGHLHISEEALKRLPIDEVWWLVSPLNPLKSAAEAAPYDERLKRAQELARGQRILVSDFENRHGTRFTFDTLAELSRAFPDKQFVWLMGADNLAEFHRWKSWQEIPEILPIAIFDRPGYASKALSSPFARRFRQHRLPGRKAQRIWELSLPAWIFIQCRRHAESSTRIREEKKQNRRSR